MSYMLAPRKATERCALRSYVRDAHHTRGIHRTGGIPWTSSAYRDERILVVYLAVQHPSIFLFTHTAPLLEEKRNPHLLTINLDVLHPERFHPPRTVAALAAYNHPIHISQYDCRDVPEKRLERKESYRSGCRSQHIRPPCVVRVLDRCSDPYIRHHWLVGEEPAHALRALRQHLIGVSRRGVHRKPHFLDELVRYVLVKQVAHTVDEHATWLLPVVRLLKSLRSKNEIKSSLKVMAGDTAPPLRECLGVAMITTRRNFRATRDGIPRCIGPLDRTICTHLRSPSASLIPGCLVHAA